MQNLENTHTHTYRSLNELIGIGGGADGEGGGVEADGDGVLAEEGLAVALDELRFVENRR